jgi:hypothetical protein
MSSPKYNRTPHLPWSKGATNDDKIAKSIDRLIGVPIVITEKLDGSNASIERDGVFARTHAHGPAHPSFDWLKAFHSSLNQVMIPRHYQLFGENVWARHSLSYNALPGYFLLFGVREWRDDDLIQSGLFAWRSWDGPDGVEFWAKEIGVPTVPVLFKGMVKSAQELQDLTEGFLKQLSLCGGEREGVVARVASAFDDHEFSQCVCKMVRFNHVNTDIHWANQPIVKNKLKLSP